MKYGLLLETTLAGLMAVVFECKEKGSCTLRSFKIAVGGGGVDGGDSLATLVSEALSAAGNSLSDISYLAVSTGPGSFTGIKIGIAYAQGLLQGSSNKLDAFGLSALSELHRSSAAKSSIWLLPSTVNQGYAAISSSEGVKLALVMEQDGHLYFKYDADDSWLNFSDLMVNHKIFLTKKWTKVESALTLAQSEYSVMEGDKLVTLAIDAVLEAVGCYITVGNFDKALEPNYIRKSTPEEKLTH
jgi:tRNA A37 threonylcarbamoyladenosine modification protein TsaB